jgi:cell division protein FtsW
MSVATTLRTRLNRQQPADQLVIWSVLVLCAVGIVAVYSAITFLAETKAAGDSERFLVRHVMRVGLALGFMAIFSFIDYRWLARFSKVALVLAIVLLVMVPIVGVVSGGAARWLRLGSFGFQPSDLAKVALVLYVGVLLARKQAYIKSFSRAFMPLMVWILLAGLLIGIEDLSTAVLVVATCMLMCFVGRVSVLHLGLIVVVASLLASMLLMASPGRAARVEAFLGVKIFPHTEEAHVFSTQSEGYQAQQARIAFAMGGLTGVGPGKSVQRDFLPAPYNDFIFAIVAEEFGLMGALFLLAVLLAILFRGFLRISRYAPDPLGLFLGIGFTAMLALYGFVHAGVSSGFFPVTGLPLPFVSYGGTSMLATGIMVGILLNISRQAGIEKQSNDR